MQKKDQGKRKPRRPKKFRSQILAEWLTQTYTPCKAADVGGGKGLLAYLLNQSGWDVTVIDPEIQDLPRKYTDLNKKKVTIPLDSKIKRIDSKFEKEMAKEFDLLIGLHVHGSCMKIIEAAKEFNVNFAILPCCVIDEPIQKMPDIDWYNSLVEYAKSLGLDVKETKLGFMGKDRVIYTTG